MNYETLLFTRNQRQDFTAFVRPALLSNKDVSAIGAIFNYVGDISRLTAEFPSLYCFPLSDYLLLLRHYNSGRQHAGRAIGVIEGMAIAAVADTPGASADFAAELAEIVAKQADLLNVSATMPEIDEETPEMSAEDEWRGAGMSQDAAPFITEFLERREEDRLFLPFTIEGREMLIAALADRRFTLPPFFAFGTNSDVLAQLEQQASIDFVSFFKTERPSFRSRKTNRVSGYLDGSETETTPDPSMALRSSGDETHLRPESQPDAEVYEDTRVGAQAMSIRSGQRSAAVEMPSEGLDEDDDSEATVLTMRQIRDKMRAEEATRAPEPEQEPQINPIRWLIKFVSSLISPSKPE